MNDTPPNIQLFPVMDFETLSNFMNYQYPKNFNGIYSYVSSMSHQQLSFFHNINNQIYENPQTHLNTSKSIFTHIAQVTHIAEVTSDTRISEDSTDMPKNINCSSVETDENNHINLTKSGSGKLSGGGQVLSPSLMTSIHQKH